MFAAEIMSSSEPVTIATFRDICQAEFAQSVLEGSGIDAFIQQPFIASIAPHLMIGAGGVQVMVAGADAQRARDVLSSIEGDESPEAGG